MADYFAEHNCAPLGDGERPSHSMHFARLLLDGGWTAELDADFVAMLFGGRRPPPAAKRVVASLQRVQRTSHMPEVQCTVCLKAVDVDETLVVLPCMHRFHSDCILPWLQMTNSCPLCRHELPTDDDDYEQHRVNKERLKQKESVVDELHDSMYS